MSGVECEIVHVENGVRALSYLSHAGGDAATSGKRSPDLIVLDLKLPGLSGFEILQMLPETLRAARPLIAVLSGSSHQADVDRALTLGAMVCFEKPITAAKVHALFARRSLKAGALTVSGAALPGGNHG